MSEYRFPTAEEVDARIAYVEAHPECRPPSGDYCRDCLLTGLAHCSDPSRAGDEGGCGARVPYGATV